MKNLLQQLYVYVGCGGSYYTHVVCLEFGFLVVLWCVVLCCVVLCCVVLCCAVSCCVVLCRYVVLFRWPLLLLLMMLMLLPIKKNTRKTSEDSAGI